MKELEIFSGDFSSALRIPYADGGVRAGFPSPAQDYMDRSLDFNKELIAHPAATFYARVV
ncbi:peptidase S24, partial [Parabacteroides distasonis]